MNKNTHKNKRHRNFEDYLSERLKNPALAFAYLNEALANEDQRVFLLALKNVLNAQAQHIILYYFS